MTTENQPQVDAAEVLSRLGRIEGEQAQMNSHYDDINKRFDEMDENLDCTIARLDRLEAGYRRILYWYIGLGIATLASIWIGILGLLHPIF